VQRGQAAHRQADHVRPADAQAVEHRDRVRDGPVLRIRLRVGRHVRRRADRTDRAGDGPEQAAPFPPEPLAYLGVQATRWSLACPDRRSGRRNLWLRALDAVGLGYDS